MNECGQWNEDEAWTREDAILELMTEIADHILHNYDGYKDVDDVMRQHADKLRDLVIDVVTPKR